ncbi:hypothetical protein [Ruegeria sp. ANG-R]|uniref:hypothetical protein n=1 Tax=Ruegeria sp. ANG-R TaxID=1577903 RepID=UPI0012699DF4|nr:hypothetical protein [Ruegeria sp. ANG-R]
MQFKTDCLPGREIVTESESGTVTFGFKVGEKTTTSQREVEHSNSLPKDIVELVSQARTCINQAECVIEREAMEIVELLSLIDPSKGSWRFQLGSSSRKPTYGAVAYFAEVGEALIAFRTADDEDQSGADIKIFPYILAEDSK